MKLCSACLLGLECRYDKKRKADSNVLELTKHEILIPVCPEQLGGLSTPRDPAEKKEERVITKSGQDVTEEFVNGAKMVLQIAKLLNVKSAILKQRSPSCGCGQIYDGTFSNTKIKGNGITTMLLLENGIEVQSEEDL